MKTKQTNYCWRNLNVLLLCKSFDRLTFVCNRRYRGVRHGPTASTTVVYGLVSWKKKTFRCWSAEPCSPEILPGRCSQFACVIRFITERRLTRIHVVYATGKRSPRVTGQMWFPVPLKPFGNNIARYARTRNNYFRKNVYFRILHYWTNLFHSPSLDRNERSRKKRVFVARSTHVRLQRKNHISAVASQLRIKYHRHAHHMSLPSTVSYLRWDREKG